MTIEENLLILVLALWLDRLIGDPAWLWSRIAHPVVLFGKGIAFFDRRFNRHRDRPEEQRLNGVVSIVVLLALSIAAGLVLHRLFNLFGLFGILLEVLLVSILLAQKSLADHVGAVAGALRREGLHGGRREVAKIVGRDPETLDEPGICRAAIESLAENFSDGVVAPALFYAVFGLPGLFLYKMVNTADSMIGHRSPKYLHFGWASARLDDLANWPAARLSVLLIAAGAFLRRGADAGRAALSLAWRDGGLHRSPNSGRPEAAMAGALDLQLAGPRIYGGAQVQEPMLNAAGRGNAGPPDIDAALSVFHGACNMLAALALGFFLLLL